MSQLNRVAIGIYLILLMITSISLSVNAQAPRQTVDVAWNSTGLLIATVDYDGNVSVLDNANQVVFYSGSNGFGASIAWSPTSPDMLAISTRQQGTTLYNINTEVAVAHFNTDIVTYSVAFSPDGNSIVTGHGTPGDGPLAQGYINVTEIATGLQPVIFESVAQRIASVGWSPNGNFIAGLNIGDSGEVVTWDANTGEVLQRITEAHESTGDELGNYVTGHISDFAWSPNSTLLAVGTELKVAFWDLPSNTRLRTSDYLWVIEDIAWHPSENTIAVASGFHRQILLVDVTSGQVIDIIPTSFDVLALSWSPNGMQIGYGGTTELIVEVVEADLPTQTPTQTFTPLHTPTNTPTATPTSVLNTIILSPTPTNPLTLSEETRAWYNYNLTLSATLTGSECVTVRLEYFPPTPTNYAHVQTRVKRPVGQEVSWSTAQTLVFDANHTEYEVRIRARDDSTNLTGSVGRLSHRITVSNVAGYPINTVDASGMRLTGSPFNGGNDSSAAADSRNVLVFTVEDND